MDDAKIIELYFARKEDAIVETDKRYGRYCRYIACNILNNDADAEEIVNDTYLKVWNSVPPKRPNPLKSYLGKICNRLAINRYYEKNAEKRGGGQVALALEELAECVSGKESDIADELALKNALDRFLASLPQKTRNIFVRRYWYGASVSEISKEYGIGESYVTVLMLRTRKKLKAFLQKEGFEI